MSYTRDMFENKTSDEIYTMFGGKDKLGTTSKAIRELLALNYTRSQVAKMLNIRYQHVRNVQLQVLKREPKVEEHTNDDKNQMKFDF